MRAPAVLIIATLAAVSCDRAGTTSLGTTLSSESTRTEFDLKVRCQEIGRRYWDLEFGKLESGTIAINPSYTYSKELNTCVVYAGMMSKAGRSEFLIDVLSNRELASSSRYGDVRTGQPQEEFEVKKRQFFPLR